MEGVWGRIMRDFWVKEGICTYELLSYLLRAWSVGLTNLEQEDTEQFFKVSVETGRPVAPD